MKTNIKITTIFLIVMFYATNTVFAQKTFKEVDSISYQLYKTKKWKELASFGSEISKSAFDYYLLNLRLGIANYKLKRYSKSIYYFKKAVKNNSATTLPKEYLYWNYWFLKDAKNAKKYFNQLDKKTQDKIKKELAVPVKFMDFIYLEGGKNMQEDKSLKIGDVTYFNLGLQHNFSSNLSFYHSYYYQQQKLETRDTKMSRYYAAPKLKYKDLEFALLFNYLQKDAKINTTTDITERTVARDTLLEDGYTYDRIKTINQQNKLSGTSKTTEFHLNLNVTKLFKKFKIGLFGGVTNSDNTVNTTENIEGIENIVLIYQGNEVFNKDYDYTDLNEYSGKTNDLIYNYGVDFGVDITNNIGLGIEVSMVANKSQSDFNYVATATYKLNNRFNFSANYIAKNKLPYYYYNSAYVIYLST